MLPRRENKPANTPASTFLHATSPTGACLARLAAVIAACGGAAGIGSPATAGVKNWNIASGTWGSAGAWSPFGVPGPADVVFIGNTAAATNATIDLTADAAAQSITITDGMYVRNDGWRLTCAGLIAISGENETPNGTYSSTLQLSDSGPWYDIETGSLNIAAFGHVTSMSGSLLVHETMNVLSFGTFEGIADVSLTGDITPSFRNDGVIDLLPGFSRITQFGNGLIDLDGDTVGELGIQMTSVNQNPYQAPELRVSGTALSDPMDDFIHMAEGAELNMELDSPWTLGVNGKILVLGASSQDALARVQGAPVTVEGDIKLLGQTSKLVFDASSTLTSSMVADVDLESLLWFWGSTIEGGTFNIGTDSTVRFSGETTVHGGVFNGTGPAAADGGVDFNGPTTYDGTVTINGYGIQHGDATVVGPTVLNADTFDTDGFGASWAIGHTLTINADSIGFLNQHAGDIDLSGSLFGKLTMNLPQPTAHWTMYGSLKLGSLGQLLLTRIAGSPVRLAGSTTVSKAVQITAPTEFLGLSDLGFEESDARLRFTNATAVDAATTVSGGGKVEIAASGSLLLRSGADLAATDLSNEGVLSVDEGPGFATIDQLTLAPTSMWRIGVGGYDEGTEYDQLFVNGSQNVLAGQLDVDLLDLGSGHFEPQIGDVFAVLIAPPASLSGLFANAPMSSIPGKTYLWNVGSITGEVAHIVTLTVADIVPCQADLNGDGAVDASDLAILLGAWGANPGDLADFNDDGMVAADDLAVLLGAWGLCVIQ